MTEATTKRRTRGPRLVGLLFTALAMSALLATSALAAVVNDSGDLDVQVATHDECETDTTNGGAIVSYIGVECEELGSAGTGVFESFVRVHASPTEQGYNTDSNDFQFDEVGGTWTHSVLVSDIPVIDVEGTLYWELYADINESNANATPPPSQISLNDLEVYYTDDPAITGYPFAGTAEPIYDFDGSILINDVNSGSGEADLRYLIPLTGIDIPDDCGYKDDDCEVFFVLYTQWGTTLNYSTDGGFEEWKVKTYPFVNVEKTANTSFTTTFEWDIDKSVTPAEWDLFTGDTGTSEYTVELTKGEGVDSDWAVAGLITITNPGTLDAVVTSVTDQISGAPTDAVVVCESALPVTLDPGDTLECSYSTDLPDGSDQTNTATVALLDGTVFIGEADVTFGDPTTTVNDTVNVTDTLEGDLGEFSDSGSVSYETTFACDADEGVTDNTATIVETDQSDSASVTVNCYALNVSKDADEGFTRTYEWDIDKTSEDPTELTLNPGETYEYPYDVTVSVTGFTDSAMGVSGSISVENPAPIAATINSVTDVVSPDISADVDCGVTFPYTLAAESTLECTYSADLPDSSDRTNTATATLQNYDYDHTDAPVASGTTDFTGTADVDFEGAAMIEVDECIDVTDTLQGDLGEVCVGDAPKTFSYDRTITATEEDCEGITITNTASFITQDTGATGDDDHEVIVTVPCEEGCTLTQGYWKTHSALGPAPEDLNWELLSEGPDTIFFLSEQTWYEVFWTAPKKGNPYYILAHQYEAAVLNILSGASSTAEVDAAIDWAEDFFSTALPTDTFSKTLRAEIIANAGILGSYNEGDVGPGHCSEDSIAAAANLAP